MAKAKKSAPTLSEIFSLAQTGEPTAQPAPLFDLSMSRLPAMEAQVQQPQMMAANEGFVGDVAATQDAMGIPQLPSIETTQAAKALAARDPVPENPRRNYFKDAREAQARQEAKNSLTEFKYLSPEMYKRLEDQAKGINPDTGEIDPTSPYQLQEKGIKDTQDLLALYAENTPTPLDLSPAFGFLNMHRQDRGLAPVQYKAPTPYRETFEKVMSAQKGLADQRADMAKMIRDSIRSMRSGQSTETVGNLLAETLASQFGQIALGQPRIGGAGSASDLRIKEKDVRDRINKTMQPLEERYEQLGNMKAAIDSGDYTQLGAMLSIAAKNIGAETGVLTDRDIQRVLPRTIAKDIASLQAYLTNNDGVKLEPSVTAGLRKLVAIAMTNAEKKHRASLQRQMSQYKNSKSYGNVDVDAIAEPAEMALKDIKKWADEFQASNSPKQTMAQKNAPGASGLTPEQRRARIEKLRKELGKQ